MYLILCGLLSIACHLLYSADTAQPNPMDVYTQFRQALKADALNSDNTLQSLFCLLWRTVIPDQDSDDSSKVKIVKLPHDTYLIAEYSKLCVLKKPTHFMDVALGEGYSITIISETNHNLILPRYAECELLLAIPKIVCMHAAMQAVLREKTQYEDESICDDPRGGEPRFSGKIGTFFWKIHDTFPS